MGIFPHRILILNKQSTFVVSLAPTSILDNSAMNAGEGTKVGRLCEA